jgi:NAD(P)-dependent dehydrogenase (short-subunit alcohol dehydrogenase family)
VTETSRKVAIVTGGSQGIGAGVVDGYRQLGWAVVANALSFKPSQDPGLLTIEGDISDPVTSDRIVGQTMDRFGRIDTLVNNAGVFLSKPFTDYTAKDYALVTRVNLDGFFWLTQRVITQMVKQGGGHVVNVSASAALHEYAGSPSALAALTKGGLAAVTKSLAIEYASNGIRVNAVAPGVTDTPMHPEESFTPQELAVSLPPIGRLAKVSDIVGGIMYLESAPYVTGEILKIDGGRTAGH